MKATALMALIVGLAMVSPMVMAVDVPNASDTGQIIVNVLEVVKPESPKPTNPWIPDGTPDTWDPSSDKPYYNGNRSDFGIWYEGNGTFTSKLYQKVDVRERARWDSDDNHGSFVDNYNKYDIVIPVYPGNATNYELGVMTWNQKALLDSGYQSVPDPTGTKIVQVVTNIPQWLRFATDNPNAAATFGYTHNSTTIPNVVDEKEGRFYQISENQIDETINPSDYEEIDLMPGFCHVEHKTATYNENPSKYSNTTIEMDILHFVYAPYQQARYCWWDVCVLLGGVDATGSAKYGFVGGDYYMGNYLYQEGQPHTPPTTTAHFPYGYYMYTGIDVLNATDGNQPAEAYASGLPGETVTTNDINVFYSANVNHTMSAACTDLVDGTNTIPASNVGVAYTHSGNEYTKPDITTADPIFTDVAPAKGIWQEDSAKFTVSIPSGQAAGTYKGTVTFTVAGTP